MKRWIHLGIGLLLAGAMTSCSPHAKPKGRGSRADSGSHAANREDDDQDADANRPPLDPFRADGNLYRWKSQYDPANALADRIAPPEDYVRIAAPPGSFAHWLRGLPLKPGRPDVLQWNGEKKSNQEAHHAVIDMDVGDKDLQQCADAVMRLRAEYLLTSGSGAQIKFRTGTGFWLEWTRWEAGDRPSFAERGSWSRSARADSSYRNFRAYMDKVFEYVGTASLAPQLQPVTDVSKMQIGDVLIKPGTPGHAVIVLDMAECEGDKVFLLAQSFMPAQEMHVLRNPNDPKLSPWYDLDFEGGLKTPEFPFPPRCLKRFGP